MLEQANAGLVESHRSFVNKISDVYSEVALTGFAGSAGMQPAGTSQLGRIKNLAVNQTLDEHYYNKPTERFLSSYFAECCDALGMEIYRVRLALFRSGGFVDWHIDYDPSYATRLIIPIETSAGVLNMTERNGVVEKVHLPADGSVWFINTGFRHAVSNESSMDRTALIISVNGNPYWEKVLREKSDPDRSPW